MLTSPDRPRNFKQLRAHWEAAGVVEQRAEMVGKRVKQMPDRDLAIEVQHNPGGKFRRKLSNGLAFISLTQRKTAPVRQLSGNAPLTASPPSTIDSSTAILDNDALLPPHTEFTSATTSDNPPALLRQHSHTSESHLTPGQLTRSRTYSYIPRPVKADGETQPCARMQDSKDTSQRISIHDSKPLPHTRIPTPSPPKSKRRVSSPRQYMPFNPQIQASATFKRQSLINIAKYSPPTAAVRSRTTPNLANAISACQPTDHTATPRPRLKRPLAGSVPHDTVLGENIPTSNRVAQRLSLIQDKSVKRESLAMNRDSFGTGTLLIKNKLTSLAPPVSAKRLSSHVAPTEAAAICASASAKADVCTPAIVPASLLEGVDVAQSSSGDIQGSLSSTTPAVDIVDQAFMPLPRAPKTQLSADNDMPRRTLGTPNGLGGIWRSSKVFAVASHQVRRFPRSSTFHSFGKRPEAPLPSVPPISEQHKSPSSSNLVYNVSQHSSSTSFSSWYRHPRTFSGKSGSSSKSLLSEIATAQRSSEAASLMSVSTSTTKHVPEITDFTDMESRMCELKEVSHDHRQTSTPVQQSHDARSPVVASQSLNNLLALPPVPKRLHLKRTGRSISITESGNPPGNLDALRHWSISEQFYPNNANDAIYSQVKDYMPPLYWAGRFQSRFDQWRTRAMVTMLDPEVGTKYEGPLENCSLEDEKKATILIFMQLRDLCASSQAADSLHEFEYRYRKDHRLLDSKLDLPPSLRKPDDSTAKGPIGRAVRKLTPRKASLANLFKGKGWNRSDDSRAGDVPGHIQELQGIEDSFADRETADSDSYDSSTQLHAF